jgi:hypothetical protein
MRHVTGSCSSFLESKWDNRKWESDADLRCSQSIATRRRIGDGRGLDGDGQSYWKIVYRCHEIKRNKKNLFAKSQEGAIYDKLYTD